jgi:DNA-binding NtrC family response regulator
MKNVEKKKVLIIDDEYDLCFLLKSYLGSKNFEVAIASTLNTGLNKIEDYHPDILFLDNHLPDGSGWDMAAEISGKNPSLKINLISGESLLSAHKDKVKTNVRIIEKPLSLHKIDKAVA